jgi:hypothetical protein
VYSIFEVDNFEGEKGERDFGEQCGGVNSLFAVPQPKTPTPKRFVSDFEITVGMLNAGIPNMSVSS